MFQSAALLRTDIAAASPLAVSIVMPCLDEAQSLPHCIANARLALARIEAEHGLAGEIVVADNGSQDGSQALAEALGARVVAVARRGYGAAIIGGCHAALGEYLLIGDADGSYDFTDGVAMIGRLVDGADLCVGSRFQGGIAAGAMPWKNRHIGNPALTGILNLFFGTRVDDAHCGLRAISRTAFDALGLEGAGMEFASEMIVKASLRRLAIAEAPATLSRDLRDRRPHLRPWRDGWRHLRFLMMLSPTWTLGIPAAAAMSLALGILGAALLHANGLFAAGEFFGASWTIAAGFLFVIGHSAAIMVLVAHMAGVRAGFRRLRPAVRRLRRLLTLEAMIALGGLAVAVAAAAMAAIAWRWQASGFAQPASVLPIVAAAILGASGLQTIFGAFMLAVISGHRPEFVPAADRS